MPCKHTPVAPTMLLEGRPLQLGDKVAYRAIRNIRVIGIVVCCHADRPVVRVTGRRTAGVGWPRGHEWAANPLWLERR